MKLLSITLALSSSFAVEAAVPSWACALDNCALKSPLASAGPGFIDGVRFFAAGSDGKDTRAQCPFGNDNDPEPSKKEYLRYMKGMNKVAEMPIEERRAYAMKMKGKWEEDAPAEGPAKEPSVDVTTPGVKAVNSKQWSELRTANKFDFLITFYAPWCPHCKAFVTSENSPLKAISASLEKAGGPKVVTFDMIASSAPISIDAVPTIYLFKTSGEAVMFEDDTSNLEALMAFALDKPKAAASLLAKKHELHLVAPHRHHTLASWQCPLENCVLKSPLAQAGPAFADGVRFFAVGSDGKDTRAACPFGGKNFDGEASKEEYLKYMKGLDKVGDMSADQRREWAIANQARWIEEEANEEAKPIKAPTIDITKPGAEAVNSKQWAELRNANTYDMLITFHAHWCPHCKSFVKGANAPIQALSESLEQASGAKVVSFEITESTPPLSLEAVPAVYLFKTSGEAVPYEGNPMDLDALMAWTLDNASAKKQALVSKEVVQHLRGPA